MVFSIDRAIAGWQIRNMKDPFIPPHVAEEISTKPYMLAISFYENRPSSNVVNYIDRITQEFYSKKLLSRSPLSIPNEVTDYHRFCVCLHESAHAIMALSRFPSGEGFTISIHRPNPRDLSDDGIGWRGVTSRSCSDKEPSPDIMWWELLQKMGAVGLEELLYREEFNGESGIDDTAKMYQAFLLNSYLGCSIQFHGIKLDINNCRLISVAASKLVISNHLDITYKLAEFLYQKGNCNLNEFISEFYSGSYFVDINSDFDLIMSHS